MKKTNSHHLFAISATFPHQTWEPIGSHSHPVQGQVWRSCPVWEPIHEDRADSVMYQCKIATESHMKGYFAFEQITTLELDVVQLIDSLFLSPSIKYVRIVDLFPEIKEQFSKGLMPRHPGTATSIDKDYDVFVPVIDGCTIEPQAHFICMCSYVSHIDYAKYHGGTPIQG